VMEIVLEDRSAPKVGGVSAGQVCVCGRLCRRTAEGFALAFVFSSAEERRAIRAFLRTLRAAQETGAPPGEQMAESPVAGAAAPGAVVEDRDLNAEVGPSA
jgi:hypothetical protein